jgi:hypothetical protein
VSFVKVVNHLASPLVLAATLVEELGENKYGFSMRVSVPAMADVGSAIVGKGSCRRDHRDGGIASAYDL